MYTISTLSESGITITELVEYTIDLTVSKQSSVDYAMRTADNVRVVQKYDEVVGFLAYNEIHHGIVYLATFYVRPKFRRGKGLFNMLKLGIELFEKYNVIRFHKFTDGELPIRYCKTKMISQARVYKDTHGK